jgi:uncharacterized membrane protein
MATVVRERRPVLRRRRPLPAERPPRRASERVRFALPWLFLLGLMAALVPARGNWAAEAALLALLLTVPGRLLLRALAVPGDAIAASPVYVPAASILVLLGAGLGVDLLAPKLGVAEPLRAGPVLAGVEAVSLLLLAAGLVPRPERVSIPWRGARPRVLRAWPLVLPLLGAAGALRLTAGHPPAVAIVAVAAAGAALLAGLVFASSLSRSQLALILYGAGLALAWGFSLRGHFVYGWDITAEYHVLTSTWANGVWHSAHPHDAYGAMLSLTVLPSAIHALTGVSSLVLLKALYPALFALFPVAMFTLASRLLSRRYAFVAAAFVAVQNYFFQQLPAIARQEIGLLLFVVLVAAVFDSRLRGRSRVGWILLLGLGVAVSHYSTTYMALALFGVALFLQLVVSLFRDLPRVSGAVAAAFVATVVGAAVWYGPVTHSTSNVAAFTTNLRENGLNLLPNAQPGQGFVKSYLTGNAPARISASQYERISAQYYAKHRSYVIPLPSASDPRYALKDSQITADAVRAPTAGRFLMDANLVASQAFNVLAILAALALVLWKRTPRLLRQIGILGIGTLAALALIRLSGTAANDYNQSRAFLQTMVPLAVGIGWLLERFAGRRSLRYWPVSLAVTGALAAIFLGTGGLRGVLVGGGTPTNLANKGEDYERFYVTAPELSAAKWLAAAAPHKGMIYTDRYGQLRFFGATARSSGLFLDVAPKTLDQHAWVYGTRNNVVKGRARAQQGSKYAIYQWPAQFLNDRYNRIYTNGSSEVWHR